MCGGTCYRFVATWSIFFPSQPGFRFVCPFVSLDSNVRFSQNSVTRYVPQLQHLQLRYCKYLTDQSIYRIAENLPQLYSLDLSFCSLLTSPALIVLLERQPTVLTELSLRSCGHQCVNSALWNVAVPSSLAMLDVRGCGRAVVDSVGDFAECGVGVFSRPSQWKMCDLLERLDRHTWGPTRKVRQGP